MKIGKWRESTELRLAEWGNWHKACPGIELGYPRRTVLGKLQEEGGFLPPSKGLRPAPVNERAEEIEDYLTLMRKIGRGHELMSTAVVLDYAYDYCITDKASMMGVSKRHYINYRDWGMIFMDAKIN